MLGSQTEIQAEVEIDAAPDLVWQHFRQIEAWPQWYPGVLAATWQQGEAWTPQAIMALQVQNSLHQRVTSQATVFAATPATLLWENQMTGLRTRCRARLHPLDDGARLTLHKTYSGAAVVLLRLLKARQEAMLRQGLENLKQKIEAIAHGDARNRE